jgi:hypothetical protein
MMKRKALWLGLMALLLLWPTATVFADEPIVSLEGGQIFVDEDVVLEPGEVFDGDLGVFDGDLTLPEGSVVNGDVFITNGEAEVSGRVNGNLAVVSGDLVLAESGWVAGDVFSMSGDQVVAGHVRGDLSVLFGDMDLRGTAVVEGDLLVLSGSIERASGARVLGEQVSEIPLPPIPLLRESPKVPKMPEIVPPSLPEVPELAVPLPPEPVRPRPETFGQRVGRFMGRVVSAAFLSLAFIAVGLLIVVLWPRATREVSDCIATLPIQSFGLGLLTYLIAAGLEALAVVLMILIILVAAALIGTVILIPVGLLLILLSVLVLVPVPLGLVAAMVLGWVGLAELIGRKVLKALKATDVKPLGAMLVGLLITVGVAAVLWILQPACCAWPFVILLTSVGLGAVVHTRFGRQSCRPPQPAAEADVLPPEAMDEEAGQADGPADETP